MKAPSTLRLLPLLLIASAPAAHAHPGHGPADLASGFVHPLSGWDHLLALVAVGLWAAQAGGRARWALPLGFVLAMAAGALAGIAGLGQTMPGWSVPLSAIATGLLIAGAARPPLSLGLAWVVLAGALHGLAHGTELPAGAGSLGFVAGMVAATALLHGAGLAIGLRAGARSSALRWMGGSIAAAGIVLALA